MIDDDDIDPVGRSRRSVGHTGGVITSRSGGMSDVLLSGAQLITQQRFHVSGRGTPLRPGIARQGRDRLEHQSRKMHPSNGVIPGGQPGGVFVSAFGFHTHRQVILLLPQGNSVRINPDLI